MKIRAEGGDREPHTRFPWFFLYFSYHFTLYLQLSMSHISVNVVYNGKWQIFSGGFYPYEQEAVCQFRC